MNQRRNAIVCRLAVALMFAGVINAAEFHVAPTGSDANPGTADKPLATLEKARDAVRASKAANGGKLKEAVTVVLHGGEYVLKQTFELAPQDSGEKGKPVCYIAAKGETPVITSARAIAGWKKYDEPNPALTKEAQGHVWFAEVPKGWRFHTLYVNGLPQLVARTPNTDVKGWRSWPRILGNARLTPEGMVATVAAGLLKGLPDNGDVEVNFLPMEYWNSLAVLKKVEGNTMTIASRNPTTLVWNGRYCNDGALSFRNALVCLDQPGEWCVDSAAGNVYFWPPDGTMAGKAVTAPTLHELIRLQGDDLAACSNDWRVKYDAKGNRVEKTTPPLVTAGASAFDQLVRHVEFRGLTFESTDRMPEDQWPKDWLKRNAENPDGALFLQGAEACTIADCMFRNCGAYAVVLDHYAQQIQVLGNEMASLGSGGVQATGYGPGTLDVNGHHAIRRNYIHSTGRDYMHSAAITIFGSGHNDISLNWIADCPYAAIQLCGAPHTLLNNPEHPMNGPCFDLQGDRTAQFQMRSHELPPPNGRNDPADYEEVKPFLHSGGNWISRNIVDEFMTTLGDGGAWYTWSAGHDNVWLENLAKRVKHHSHGWVLYMDDWTGRALIQDNLSWADSANHMDNSHNPTPAARPGSAMSTGTNAGIAFTGKTICRWNNNGNSYPAKPAGFDDRFTTIADDALAEGGWPKSVTDEMGDNLIAAAKREPVVLAAGTWVNATEVRRLCGPRFPDAKRETIGWCEGGGYLVFGPYRFAPNTINGMEVMVGVQPNYAGQKMHVRLDTADGPAVGTVVFQSTGGFESFKSQSIPVKELAGDHKLYFVFEGEAGICNFKQFRFTTEKPK